MTFEEQEVYREELRFSCETVTDYVERMVNSQLPIEEVIALAAVAQAKATAQIALAVLDLASAVRASQPVL